VRYADDVASMAWNRHPTDAVTGATSRRWRGRLKFNFHTEADGVGATPLNIEMKPKKKSATLICLLNHKQHQLINTSSCTVL
jgi:hypothetical protein